MLDAVDQHLWLPNGKVLVFGFDASKWANELYAVSIETKVTAMHLDSHQMKTDESFMHRANIRTDNVLVKT